MAAVNVVRRAPLAVSVLIKNVRHFAGVSSSPGANSFETVGFIGLGQMGNGMVKNLLVKGKKVTVYDVFPEAMSGLSSHGAVAAKDPAEVASKTNCIITMLPSSPQVLDVYTGENGILQTVKEGTLLIDSSTIDPSVSRDIASVAAKKGAVYVDAPVSGGILAASGGTLTFMVGCAKKSEFTKISSLLQLMGKNIVMCGAVGAGQAAKVCNNMLLGISMIGVAETMNLGERLGLDPKVLAKIINSSSGRCWSSEVYNPVPGIIENLPSNKNYEGGFGTALMTKDLGLAQTAATQTVTPTPLGSLAHQLYRIMCQQGYAKKDFSAVYQFLREKEK